MKQSFKRASNFLFGAGMILFVLWLLWTIFISSVIIQDWQFSNWVASDWKFFLVGPVLGGIGMLISIVLLVEGLFYAEKAEEI